MGAMRLSLCSTRRIENSSHRKESQVNHTINRGQKPALRPLPGSMPEYIAVAVSESEYRGQMQWVASYRLYHNGNDNDYVDLVVNIPRHFWPRPEDGVRLWVKPTSMAPQKRLVFAEAYGRVRDHDAPLTVRTGEELLLPFKWSQENRHYRAQLGGWTIDLRDAKGICPGEHWRVRVERIDPQGGLIEVCSVGPHPRTLYEPPTSIALLGVIPSAAQQRGVESDVFGYWRNYATERSGGQFSVEIEHEGRIIQLHCSELRKLPAGYNKDGKPIEKVMGLVRPRGLRKGYLAEIVLVEGETVQKPQLAHFEPPRIEPPVEEHDPLADPDDDVCESLIREERENSEPPDHD
jgi:hypothetical protein